MSETRTSGGRPLRILYCEGNTDGTIGGSYYSLLFLLQALDRRRVAPIVVFRRPHALLTQFAAAAESVQVLEPGTPFRFGQDAPVAVLRAPLLALQRAMNLGRFFVGVAGLARFLKQQRIDVVHLNNSVTRNHDWMLAAMLIGTPCMTHERGINDHFSRMARWLAPKLAAIVCISGAVRDNLATAGVADANLRVIPNAIDVSKYAVRDSADAVRDQYGIDPDRRVIGMVGNIKAWKGQDVVVRALAGIRRSFPTVTCVFVGDTADEDKPYFEKLRALIRELDLESNVVFTGYRQHVADVQQIFEVAIHASTAPEPFGRVLLEAMALRKPVVGSRGGAVPEIVVHGETGYTFEPGDAAALADRVMAVLEDPALAQSLGDAGYARVVDAFHISRNAEETMGIYSSVNGPRPGRDVTLLDQHRP